MELSAIHQQVVYASRDGIDLTLDIFKPAVDAASDRRPAMLFIHGGGWSAGSPGQFFWHAQQLAALGMVAASVRYRLSGQVRYPAAAYDCRDALHWLREHADELAIDVKRMSVMGSSAGAHLAGWVAVRDAQFAAEGTPPLAGAVLVHGLFDLVADAEASGGKSNWQAFFDATPAEDPGLWRDASPALHVHKDVAPTLLTHDRDDDSVPFAQSQIMLEALQREGVEAQLMETPGSGHGFVYNPENAWTKKLWPQVVQWLEVRLRFNAPVRQ